MVTDTTAPPVTPEKSSTNWLLIIAVLGGMFLAMLDQTIVGTALPRITAELGGGGLYTWVVTAYLLTSTVTVPLYGRLSDTYGRKPLLLTGIAIFLLGSALCGLAQDMVQLILFRGLQGLGAGALLPLSLALMMDTFTGKAGAKVQGAVGGVMGLSYLAGPYLGGVLTDHADWRWVFYVNLPIGLVLVPIMVFTLPRTAVAARRGRPDYLGIAIFSAAVTALLLGLTEKGLAAEDGRPHAWTSLPVAGPIAGAAALLALFVLVERRAAEPIVPLHLFRNRTYTVVNVVSFFMAFGMYAGVVFLPRYFQEARGLTASESGLRIYPLMLAMLAGSAVTGVLMSRTGRYKPALVAAPLLLIAGTVLCAGLALDTGDAAMIAWMALIGLGIGPTMSGLTVAVQTAVPPRYIGTASANLTFFRQVGGSVALAVAGTAYSTTVAGHAPAHGLPAAHAEAAATVIPWLGVAGGLVALAAIVLLPGGRIRIPEVDQGQGAIA
ncbi:MDR family MFS transporter [Bailinhaonella thermotolerans]|uniref:MDR family MFS transporter n=1 Tax=Bailinhaonella thermotolerans TaxID=1070861 RepID=UPI001F5BEB3E|nr:MDR family MFS transporter [Bailinhaonella thermotolerans]